MKHGKVSKEIAKGIKELKKRIKKAKVPPSKLDESIVIATWNIRHFGTTPREEASIHYLAEVLNQFDLIAVTELMDNLEDLSRVMKVLGRYWKAIFSDYITDDKGNKERIAYLYDTRAVVPTGLIAEADARMKSKEEGVFAQIDWWRSPYIASFKAGSFDFIMITAHIRWGDKTSDRVAPLQLLAEWIDTRINEDSVFDKDIIVMGDFNIPSKGSSTFKAVTSKGLMMPDSLMGLHGSNLKKDKRYDQILVYPKIAKYFTNKGGVVDFYTPSYEKLYPWSDKSKDKLTYEMSDHLPLWVLIDVDRSDQELNQIIKEKN